MEQTRRAGQPVEFTEEGTPAESTGSADLVAYRVVQEALTNALKYAHGSRTSVQVRHGRKGDHRGGQHGRFRLAGRRPPAGAGGAWPDSANGSTCWAATSARAGGGRRLRRPGSHPRGRPVVTAPLRVLVCDDQALIRTGFATIIDAQPDMEVVGESGDGQAAVDVADRLQPDVVVMDVRMPVLDGIEATRLLAGAGRAASRSRSSW